MSEYQYYEFRAIDKPLTEAQKTKVSALSSRAYVTSHSASFVYNYGDFHGDIENLMTKYFDAMLYITNWGSRRLIFRIPCSLIDMKKVGAYCISDEIELRKTKDKQHVLLDFNFNDEDQEDWAEGEGWLDDLIKCRTDLIQGDFRVLYLAWLKAAKTALQIEEIDDDTVEPPVPTRLGQLSPTLKTFVNFLEIDATMIAVAAQKSGKAEPKLQLEAWIKKLPATEQYDFLVHLSRGETNIAVLLNKRLQELANEAKPQKKSVKTERRTISTLIKASEIWDQKQQIATQRQADLERQRELEALAAKKSEVWKEVEILIEEKKAKSYQNAVELLQKLEELAEYEGESDNFRERLAEIKQTYSKRSALLRRLRESKLIS